MMDKNNRLLSPFLGLEKYPIEKLNHKEIVKIFSIRGKQNLSIKDLPITIEKKK
jgi:hypothetical protein